ncbi:MAG TPA: hypothetical protein VJ728_03805 [Candidatus Binataceae bacterium]|nr:hypothetical protein [Candidatus Binataceae bacterium]
MASALETTDHSMIRKWAEQRGGHPAQVKGTGGLLRIDFGEPEESLEKISWEDFFKVFDQRNIKFLYDPERNSRFNKFVRDDGEG